jgi:hypothetical protein
LWSSTLKVCTKFYWIQIENPYKSWHFEFLRQKVRIEGLKHLCEALSLYNSKCCVLIVVDSGVFSKVCDFKLLSSSQGFKKCCPSCKLVLQKGKSNSKLTHCCSSCIISIECYMAILPMSNRKLCQCFPAFSGQYHHCYYKNPGHAC